MRKYPRKWRGLERLECRRCLSVIAISSHDIAASEVGLGTTNVVSGDIDSDGDLDLLVASRPERVEGQLSWFENLDGKGDYRKAQQIGTELWGGGIQLAVSLVDLDHDGDLDVVGGVSIKPASVFWHENLDGTGQFGPMILLMESRASEFDRLHVVDLDGDGDRDLLAGVIWLENVDGQASFEERRLPLAQTAPFYTHTAPIDIDGDRDFDLVSMARTDDRVTWLENTGAWGNFAEPLPLADSTPHDAMGRDVDGDGDTDVILAGAEVAWIENLGGRSFAPPRAATTSTGARMAIDMGDLDGDGDLDLLAASRGDNQIAWYENGGQGAFSERRVVREGATFPSSVHAADLNGDGTLDIISSFWGDLEWYENAGEADFDTVRSITTGLFEIVTPRTGDIDGDGDFDVITASNYEGEVVWYENLNHGQAWTERPIAILRNSKFAQLTLGDVDGDNDLDVVGNSSDAIFWFENLDSQARAFETHEVLPVIATKVLLHDMDTDGDLDLLGWVSNEIRWIENTDGNGSFANPRHVLSLADDDRATLEAADLDGDGDPDVIVHSPSDRLLNWYENQNAGSSFVVHDIDSGRFPPTDPPSVWDIDLDGDMDVLAGGAIYRNAGRGNFTRVDTITGATHIVGAIDLDRDGDLDLVTRTTVSLRWRENQAGQFPDRQLLVDSLGFRDIVVVARVDSRDSANVLVVASEESRLYWVDFNTPGDVNYDGVFDSTDLLLVLAAGQYEDDLANNSVFETGDWNNDGEFTSSDLVLAFQAGNYVGAAPQ